MLSNACKPTSSRGWLRYVVDRKNGTALMTTHRMSKLSATATTARQTAFRPQSSSRSCRTKRAMHRPSRPRSTSLVYAPTPSCGCSVHLSCFGHTHTQITPSCYLLNLFGYALTSSSSDWPWSPTTSALSSAASASSITAPLDETITLPAVADCSAGSTCVVVALS